MSERPTILIPCLPGGAQGGELPTDSDLLVTFMRGGKQAFDIAEREGHRFWLSVGHVDWPEVIWYAPLDAIQFPEVK